MLKRERKRYRVHFRRENRSYKFRLLPPLDDKVQRKMPCDNTRTGDNKEDLLADVVEGKCLRSGIGIRHFFVLQ